MSSDLDRLLRDFIAENYFPAEDMTTFPGDRSLTQSGIVDSVGIVELMLFLENTFGITIADDEAVPENLDTLDNLARFVTAKRAQSAPATDAGIVAHSLPFHDERPADVRPLG